MPSRGSARKRPGCRTKRAYRDQQQAKAALRLIRTGGASRERTPVRAYRCNLCGRWHLTSQA